MAVRQDRISPATTSDGGAGGGRAVVYVRISDDPSGLERGVDRQEADCRDLAQSLGLDVVEVFRENDTSAFKQKTITLASGERVRRVVRPGFRALLGFLAQGGAEVMIAYDLDRAVRDPRDLEDLIDARTLHGFKVRSVTGSLRLDTDSDVAMARVLVAMANKSSADTARRVARASKQQALEGKRHGGPPPFGYRAGGSTLTPILEQAVLVREAADRLIGGESLYAIRVDWNSRGIPTGNGKLWTESTVKKVLTNPALKGVCVYRPMNPDGSVSKVPQFTTAAVWEPILDEATWEHVNTVIQARSARFDTGGPAKRMHPFSGLIRCSKCGTPMMKRASKYMCSGPQPGVCSRAVNAADVSALVEEAVLAVFAQISIDPAKAARPGGSAAADTLASQIEADKAALAQLDDDRYDGLIDKTVWTRQRNRLIDRITATTKAWQSALPPTVVAAPIDMATVAAQWEGRSPQWQHDAAALVLEAVMVGPHPKGLPTGLRRRGDETDEQFASRRRVHRDQVLNSRVEFVWRG